MATAWFQFEMTRPAWLLALLVLPVVIYCWRRSLVSAPRWQRRASLACRLLLLTVLVLVLCDIRIVVPTGRQPVTFTPQVAAGKEGQPKDDGAGGIVLPAPGERVLLATDEGAAAEYLTSVLQGQHFEADVRSPKEMPESPDELQDYELLILVNVSAASLSQRRMETIRQYVRSGGGLIAVGGSHAFSAGDYRDTALEETLPVWCQYRGKREKPSLALVLLIDRSESMEGANIESAKEAARAAVKTLGPRDKVGVVCFEDTSRWVSEIGPCTEAAGVLGQIDTIRTGGRTNLYPALDKAYLALLETAADLKHIIVLSDGDAHPRDFQKLVAEIASAGITVSTVAMEKKAGRRLLEDIAREGKGKHYFCEDPARVPEIFARLAVSAGGLGVKEDPFYPELVQSAPFLKGLDSDRMPLLRGFVRTLPKPQGQLVLGTGSGEPLLIWWEFGSGTSVAFTSDVRGPWCSAWETWPDCGRFWGQLIGFARRPAGVTHSEQSRIKPGATDGRHDPEPAEIFSPTDRTVLRTVPLWPWLLAAAAMIFVLDVALRRIVIRSRRPLVGETDVPANPRQSRGLRGGLNPPRPRSA